VQWKIVSPRLCFSGREQLDPVWFFSPQLCIDTRDQFFIPRAGTFVSEFYKIVQNCGDRASAAAERLQYRMSFSPNLGCGAPMKNISARAPIQPLLCAPKFPTTSPVRNYG
jgi:hypothetical protein